MVALDGRYEHSFRISSNEKLLCRPIPLFHPLAFFPYFPSQFSSLILLFIIVHFSSFLSHFPFNPLSFILSGLPHCCMYKIGVGDSDGVVRILSGLRGPMAAQPRPCTPSILGVWVFLLYRATAASCIPRRNEVGELPGNKWRTVFTEWAQNVTHRQRITRLLALQVDQSDKSSY